MGDPPPSRAFVVTYGPLVISEAGRAAAAAHGLPPFADGSIRREPDLEHDKPAISCLCRAGMFAPRLAVGDRVAYVAGKRRSGPGRPHRRLAAVVRVVALFDNHAAAAMWYLGQSLRLPSNCMVTGNEPRPLGHSHRRAPSEAAALDDEQVLRRWDLAYRQRARRWPRFVACNAEFVDLSWAAPVVHDEDLKAAFGHVPGTQNPGALPPAGLDVLMRRLGLSARPSSP